MNAQKKEAIKFKLNVPLKNIKYCNSKIVCYSQEILLHCGSIPRNRKVHKSTCHAPNNMKTTLNSIQVIQKNAKKLLLNHKETDMTMKQMVFCSGLHDIRMLLIIK